MTANRDYRGMACDKIEGTIYFVYSPDDGGWYAEKGNKTSKKIYKTKELLTEAIDNNKVKWEK